MKVQFDGLSRTSTGATNNSWLTVVFGRKHFAARGTAIGRFIFHFLLYEVELPLPRLGIVLAQLQLLSH